MRSLVVGILAVLAGAVPAFAQSGESVQTSLARIRVQGRHLVDGKGNCVRLMGVMQSIHPFFNHGYWGGGSDDAAFLENKTTVGLYATTENL